MLEVANLVEAGEISRFPFVWLRDNCTCPSCFHAKSSSRLTSFSGLDLDDTIVAAEQVTASVQDTRLGRQQGSESTLPPPSPALRLSWSSGHESVFPLQWLAERCFSQKQQQRRSKGMDTFALLETTGLGDGESDAGAVPIPGAREAQARRIPRFRFEDLTDESDPQAMLGWCHALQKYGVAIVETDNHAGVLKHFTQLFGFREWCSYGASQPLPRLALFPAPSPLTRVYSTCRVVRGRRVLPGREQTGACHTAGQGGGGSARRRQQPRVHGPAAGVPHRPAALRLAAAGAALACAAAEL